MATTSTAGAPEGQSRGPLQDLEDLLHCGICFDYFNIAMIIPQCSHNYCSLCIRKFLSYKTQCPTCCVTVTESELRNNRLLDDLVRTFVGARKHLFQSLLDSTPQSPQELSTDKLVTSRRQGTAGKVIKQENKSMDKFLVKTSTKVSRRSSSATNDSMDAASDGKLNAPSSPIITVKQEPGVLDQSLEDMTVPSTPSTSLAKVKVECPVCGVGILEQYINTHLDSCLTRDEKKESLRSSVQKRKPMAKVVYNLLSERDLKKRLKEVGLSIQGSKQQMIRRHQEFVHMYNAQCDSLNPKSAEEIVNEIEKNEKIRSVLEAKHEKGMTFTKEQSEEQIDKIHQDYRKKHKNEFQQLIEQVKGRWKTPKGKKVKEEVKEWDSNIGNVSQENQEEAKEKCSPNHLPLPEIEKYSPLKTGKASVFRSSSPVFPLSPESRASSSSDILRDIEEAEVPEASSSSLSSSDILRDIKEAEVPEASSSALDQSGSRRKKRKASSSTETPSQSQTSRSKRKRK